MDTDLYYRIWIPHKYLEIKYESCLFNNIDGDKTTDN